MSDKNSRKYIKTKFEGVYYRSSSKRDPHTGEQDRIYVFWYADDEGKGHWKTVGRHSQGIRPATARRERTKFLAEFETTGINPIVQDKVTLGQVVDAYNAWGIREGKYTYKTYEQYNAHLRKRLHPLPLSEITPGLLTNIKELLLNTRCGNSEAQKKAGTNSKSVKMLAASSVNRIFNFLRSAINRAIATGVWKGNNPLSTRGGVWTLVKTNNRRLRFLTVEEAKALLDDLEKRHPQLHDMVLLSLRTGLRPTEMFRLKGQDIDANANVLYILAKGGSRVPVRVPADMIQMLQGYGRKPAEPIFRRPHKGTAFTKTPPCFRTAVKKLNWHLKTEIPSML